MADYLGQGLALLVNGLAPDVIVVIGEVTRAWPSVGQLIADSIKAHSFTRATTRIVPTDPISQPRLRGTIALVLQKHFGAPSVALNALLSSLLWIRINARVSRSLGFEGQLRLTSEC